MKLDRSIHNDEDIHTFALNFAGAVDSATLSLSAIEITEPKLHYQLSCATSSWEQGSSYCSAGIEDQSSSCTQVQGDLADCDALEKLISTSVQKEMDLSAKLMKNSDSDSIANTMLEKSAVEIIVDRATFPPRIPYEASQYPVVHGKNVSSHHGEVILKRKRAKSLGSGPVMNTLNCDVNLGLQYERWAKNRNELLTYFMESSAPKKSRIPSTLAVEEKRSNSLDSMLTSSSFWDEFVCMDKEVNIEQNELELVYNDNYHK